LASIAKRNARRQRPRASGVRRRNREAADNPNIAAVYHAAAIGKLLQNAGRNFDFDRRQRQERVVNRA